MGPGTGTISVQQMKSLRHLFELNGQWAAQNRAADPEFFTALSENQTPRYLWIGCSDSRVPAETLVGLQPGELFVHRNVANLVVHTDFNCLSVIQYAVEVLKIEHIIVCGHYGCGGIRTALQPPQLGLIDNWLRHVKDVYSKYEHLFTALDGDQSLNRLCELNVIEQVHNVCHTTIVQQAWHSGQRLSVHGWIYSMEDGLLKDLNVVVESQQDIEPIYRTAADLLTR